MPEALEDKQIKVTRTKCPFYGFSSAMGLFLDSRGNQCPLKDGYSPCMFVYQQKEPNWQECPFNRNNPGLLEKVKDCKIFPDEHEPNGVKFRDWADYILQGTPLPIEV